MNIKAAYFALASLAVIALSIAACAKSPASISLPAVGPEPDTRPESRNGTLVVWTELERVTPPFEEFEYRRSEFDVYSDTKHLAKHIANARNSSQPVNLSLEPGRYVVVAPARQFGIVSVPVRIEFHASTYVHLDGSELENAERHSAEETVRLPNGVNVGWASYSVASQKALETLGKRP